MKTNLDYYTHEVTSHQHPKFKTLRGKYGWEGEGRFWALNNVIANSNLCILDLNREFIRKTVAADLGLTVPEFEEFIQFLIHGCELVEELNPLCITTDRVQECLKEVEVSRQFERDRKKAWRDRIKNQSHGENVPEKTPPRPRDNPHVPHKKESKVKESKENKGVQGDKPPIEPKKKFVKPTIEELTAEFRLIGYGDGLARIRANKFFNHYESKNWKVGKNPMVDWKAAVHGTWNELDKPTNGVNGKTFTQSLKDAQENSLFK